MWDRRREKGDIKYWDRGKKKWDRRDRMCETEIQDIYIYIRDRRRDKGDERKETKTLRCETVCRWFSDVISWKCSAVNLAGKLYQF